MHPIRLIIIKKIQDAAPQCGSLPPEIASIVKTFGHMFNMDRRQLENLASEKGIALLAQHVNRLAKTDDKRWYECKNMLTRWLAQNHHLSYFDKNVGVLYVPIGPGKQVSFHVGHDIRENPGVEKIYDIAGKRSPILWDGISRQDMAEDYLMAEIKNDESAQQNTHANEILQTHPEEFFKQDMTLNNVEVAK